jgi:hypothetical protein
MELPSYDPAIGANVLSALALLISLASYKLSKSAAESAADATQPDVLATCAQVEGHSGWISINLKITNHLPNDLEFTSVKLIWPLPAVGLTQHQASDFGIYGEMNLKEKMPTQLARRNVETGDMLAPAGTASTIPHDARGTIWVSIYVKAQPGWLSNTLRFDAVFSLRKTDVRRFKRIVIPQRIKLPSRQTT